MIKNKKLIYFFELVAQFKVYFSNASLYLSIVNFIMILATFKLTYNINISVFILAPVGFIGVLIMGYIDYKLIFLKQTRYVNKQNDLKIQLNRIEDNIDNLILNNKKYL